MVSSYKSWHPTNETDLSPNNSMKYKLVKSFQNFQSLQMMKQGQGLINAKNPMIYDYWIVFIFLWGSFHTISAAKNWQAPVVFCLVWLLQCGGISLCIRKSIRMLSLFILRDTIKKMAIFFPPPLDNVYSGEIYWLAKVLLGKFVDCCPLSNPCKDST